MNEQKRSSHAHASNNNSNRPTTAIASVSLSSSSLPSYGASSSMSSMSSYGTSSMSMSSSSGGSSMVSSYGALLTNDPSPDVPLLSPSHSTVGRERRHKNFIVGVGSIVIAAAVCFYFFKYQHSQVLAHTSMSATNTHQPIASTPNQSAIASTSSGSILNDAITASKVMNSTSKLTKLAASAAAVAAGGAGEPAPFRWDNNDIIRGVNIGGWLVLEPWITPSLFAQFKSDDLVVDEYTFWMRLGKREARRQLEEHWRSWVVEDDIRTLANAGLTHLRVPVPYWMVDILPTEPFVDGTLPHLKRLLEWARKYKLKVVLDLHTAPGSQNGFDNSGRKGEIHWGDASPDGTHPFIDRSVRVVHQLATIFGASEYSGVVVAIEVLNEPFVTLPLDLVQDYYIQCYHAIRSVAPNMMIFVSDSFRLAGMWHIMQYPQYEGVFLDTHIYQVFDSYRLHMTPQQHAQQTCDVNKPQIQASSTLYTVVGEWSLATTDCAQWLNGMNTGARYDGKFPASTYIGSCDGQNDVKSSVFTREYREFLREFAEKQMDAYEAGHGWFFWTFKTESAPQWDYLMGLREGWLPKNASRRTYHCESSNSNDNY